MPGRLFDQDAGVQHDCGSGSGDRVGILPDCSKTEQVICDTQIQMNRAQAELQKPFEKAEELKAAQERLTVLNMLLSQDTKSPAQHLTQPGYESGIMEY